MATMLKKKEIKELLKKELVPVVAVLKNVSGRPYYGDDSDAGRSSIAARAGETIEVSEKKAAQLLGDFPDRWELVKTLPDATEGCEERLAKALAAGLARTRTKDRPVTVTAKATKIVRVRPSDEFVDLIRAGKVRIEKVEPSGLLVVVKDPGYIGVNGYAHALPGSKPEDGEIGGNLTRAVRYVLVKKGTLPKPESKEKKPVVEEFQVKGEVAEVPATTIVPRQSRDFGVGEVGGFGGVADDDDDDGDDD